MVFNHVLRQHRHGDEALHVLELVGKAQGEHHGTAIFGGRLKRGKILSGKNTSIDISNNMILYNIAPENL